MERERLERFGERKRDLSLLEREGDRVKIFSVRERKEEASRSVRDESRDRERGSEGKL